VLLDNGQIEFSAKWFQRVKELHNPPGPAYKRLATPGGLGGVAN